MQQVTLPHAPVALPTDPGVTRGPKARYCAQGVELCYQFIHQTCTRDLRLLSPGLVRVFPDGGLQYGVQLEMLCCHGYALEVDSKF